MLFTLFRIICKQPYETSLFPSIIEPREAILALLKQQPSGEIREGYTWHVGNLNIVSEDYIWFRFGRISDAIVPQYDEIKKNFIDEESEQAPNALMLIDMHYQVIAIENKYQLHPKVTRIGSTFERILNEWLTTTRQSIKIEIRELRDLEDIIQLINNSHRIRGIEYEVARRNNWDVEEHVQRRHEDLLEFSNADLATTEITGSNIHKEAAIKITRAINAKGRPVKIKAMRRPGEKATKKTSMDKHKTISVDKPKTNEDMVMTLDTVRLEYTNMRHGT